MYYNDYFHISDSFQCCGIRPLGFAGLVGVDKSLNLRVRASVRHISGHEIFSSAD